MKSGYQTIIGVLVALTLAACGSATKTGGDPPLVDSAAEASAEAPADNGGTGASVSAAAADSVGSVAVSDGESGGADNRISGPPAGGAQDFLLSVDDRVFFDFDRHDLRDDAVSVLNSQAAWLNRHDRWTVYVEGHADERGTREYNLALSERRANAVREYLVARGVASGRIRIIGYGKERPAVIGANDNAWSQNRRAVTVLDARR